MALGNVMRRITYACLKDKETRVFDQNPWVIGADAIIFVTVCPGNRTISHSHVIFLFIGGK